MRQITQPDNTTALLISEAQRMEIARLLAKSSACLDCLKNPESSPESLTESRIEATGIVLQQHQLAYEFAGDRAHEIFDESDGAEPDMERLLRRGAI